VGSTGLAAVFAFCAGLGGAVQVAVQGRLGDRVGSIEAVACAAIVSAVCGTAVLLVARGGLGRIGSGFTGPRWQLLGGVMSAVIVLAITVAGPRIGIVATTAMLIAGQFALATAIDRFGWFGVDRVAVTWSRVLGLALLAAGAVLTLRR
jgi:bacterial/archaeal transporter family-2 protein